MSEYFCERCHKIFNRKSHLDQHLKRKNICKIIPNIIPNDSKIFQNIPNNSNYFINNNKCNNLCAYYSKTF